MSIEGLIFQSKSHKSEAMMEKESKCKAASQLHLNFLHPTRAGPTIEVVVVWKMRATYSNIIEVVD